jgi:uncharacterized protein
VENSGSPLIDGGEITLLVYTCTTNYPHESIPNAVQAFQELGASHGFTVIHSADPGMFRDRFLETTSAVAFVNNSGEVLDPVGKGALQRFVRSGRGFMGVHGAAATLEEWGWYVDLIGATFKSHPPVQPAIVHTVDRHHPATAHFPDHWEWTDEWYNFRSFPVNARVLLTVDESTYRGGEHGSFHPISWCREFEGSRVFYTAIGHQPEAFEDQTIREHLLGGVLYVTGKKR